MLKYRRAILVLLTVVVISQVTIIIMEHDKSAIHLVATTQHAYDKTSLSYKTSSNYSAFKNKPKTVKQRLVSFQDKILEIKSAASEQTNKQASNFVLPAYSREGTTAQDQEVTGYHGKLSYDSVMSKYEKMTQKGDEIEQVLNPVTRWVGRQYKNSTGPKIVSYKLSGGYRSTFDRYVDLRRCEFNDCTFKFIPRSEWKYNGGNVSIDADAVILQGNRLPRYPLKRRDSNQAWIFFDMECPWYATMKYFQRPRWIASFNWTMTYRTDSDLPNPYALPVLRSGPPLDRNYTELLRNKTKSILWFVSHCKTSARREEYAKELRKYIDMDIYGGCTETKKSCTFVQRERCLFEEIKPYKFYLSFENTLCKDYVTEKFYTFLNLDIIPIVRGGANYSALAPKGSFIDAADFESPKALAGYLQFLSNNEEEYIKYLKVKDQYSGVTRAYQRSFCTLCERLHNVRDHQKVINDINKWWYQDTCKKPGDLDFLSADNNEFL